MTDLYQHFVPLDSDSQSDTENVFYYNKTSSLEALYNNVTGSIQSLINLHVNLYNYHNCDPSMLHAVAVITTRLLNDAYSLLAEFTPEALMTRAKAEMAVNAFIEENQLKATTHENKEEAKKAADNPQKPLTTTKNKPEGTKPKNN